MNFDIPTLYLKARQFLAISLVTESPLKGPLHLAKFAIANIVQVLMQVLNTIPYTSFSNSLKLH